METINILTRNKSGRYAKESKCGDRLVRRYIQQPIDYYILILLI